MSVAIGMEMAASAAANEIENGMLVGLGTGRTAMAAVTSLARRVSCGLRIKAVASSKATERAASAHGISILPFETISHIDLAIDGADEIDANLRAIKGAGGALLREKIVATAASRMICIVDVTKTVSILGSNLLPIEVLPFARSFVAREIARLGGEAHLRTDGNEPVETDQGNFLMDCRFHPIADPQSLALALQDIPGLLEHGLFLSEIDELFIGYEHGVERRTRRTSQHISQARCSTEPVTDR